MNKNCYFRCSTCGYIITKFMDSRHAEEVLTNLICPHCGGKEFKITDGNTQKPNKKLKNKLRDYRGLDKEKYMSQDYKDIRKEINRVHKERKGLLGERRVFA